MTLRPLAAALALILAANAHAQRFGDAVEVTIVEVPVTVVDRAGNPVRNLTKEDFEITDDGKRVPIEYFDVVDIARLSAAEPRLDAPLPPVATRHFLLLFDLANSDPITLGRAREAAKQFVTSQMGELDLAAVATFSTEAGSKLLTSFTKNRALLADAIETLGHPRYFKVGDPLMISAFRVEATGGASNPALAAREGVDAALAELAEDQNRAATRLSDAEMKNRLKIQMESFGNIARVLDRLPGQKQVILLSEGFDARLVQGREPGSDQARRDSEQVLGGAVYSVNTDNRFGSTSSSRDVEEMAEIFRRSDVVLHAIDIRGLRGNTDASTAAGGGGRSNEALFLLASPTGGTVFKNENDLAANFSKMLKRQEVVYLLGFTAQPTGKPARFHELKVRTKAGRATHRPGYFEATGKITELEKTLGLAEIMTTDAPIRDVEVTFAATPLPGPGGKSRLPVVVEIPGPTILEGVTGNAATANLYLYAFNEAGEVADFLQQRISLDLTKAGDTVRKSGVRYFGTLRVPPGNYAIKALVRVDESGRVGFLREDLGVPAFATATILPPVVFVEPSNWVMLMGPARGDEYAYPFAAGDAKYIPQRPATMQADGEYKVALTLVRVPLENLQVSPTLITNGAARPADVKLLGRTSPEDGAVKLVFTFRTTGLTAGEHELRFDVKAQDGTASVVTLPIRVL